MIGTGAVKAPRPFPVEQSHFRSLAFSIADIPADARFRSRLRIYSLNNEGTPVVVRLYAARTVTSGLLFVLGRVDPDPLVRTDTYTAEPQTASEGISVPAVVEVPLDLSGVTTEFARVEIEPLAHNSNVWAIVSVTNNEAQHITVLSP